MGLCLLAALTLQLATGSTAFAQIKLKLGAVGTTDEKSMASFTVSLENPGVRKLVTGKNVKYLKMANTEYNSDKWAISTVAGTNGTVFTANMAIVVNALNLPVVVTVVLDNGMEITGEGDVDFKKIADAPPPCCPPLPPPFNYDGVAQSARGVSTRISGTFGSLREIGETN